MGNGDGGDGGGFLATLSEGLQSNELLSSMESADTLAQSYLDLHGKYNELENQHGELRGKIPRAPEKPDDYEFSLPQGYEGNEERLNAFRQRAFNLGLSQEQFTDLLNWDIESDIENANAIAKARANALKETETHLKQEWGDKYEENVEIARNAYEKLTSNEFREIMDRNGLKNDPIVVHTFHNLGIALSEDAFISAQERAKEKRGRGEGDTPMLDFPSMDK